MSRDGPTTLLETRRPAAAPHAPQAAVLLAFDRLLTAGALYPMGHARFDAAVQEYRQAASQACGARRVEVESVGDSLMIQDIALDKSHRGQERLTGLFERLGIQRILIDADAPPEALHRLATGLLRQRREADREGHLKQAVFDDLPVQVAVVPRTFRKRWTDGIDARFVPIIEAILDDAVAACESPESGRMARETLEKMFVAFLADGQDNEEAGLCAPEDREVIESLLLKSPTRLADAIRLIIRRDGNLSRIDELFDDSHEALTTAAARNAVKLLMEVMQRPSTDRDAQVTEVEDRHVDDEEAYKLSLDELRLRFAEFEQACVAERPEIGDVREEISVYLSLLALGTTEGLARQALAGLWHSVQRVESSVDREFLRETACTLMTTADQEILDQVLPRLAGPFRERGSDATADYWQSLVAGDEERLVSVWPHLVIELLRTQPEAGMQGLSVMQGLVTALPPQRMLEEARRFDRLASFRPASFNKNLFYRPPPVLHPLYAALLSTPVGDTFGGWLQEGFLRTAEDTAGGLLARILGPYKAAHAEAYDVVLRSNPDEKGGAPPRALLNLVRQKIERLDPDERLADWVPVAILVLGTWHKKASARLLEQIVRQRRMFVLRAWPKPCRVAAKHALTLGGPGNKKAGRR